MDPLQDLPGTTLADRYQVGDLLGRGAMGAVFRARPADGGAEVAIKIVLPDRLEESDTLVPRFLREARLAQRIEHPNAVQVLDFGRWGPERERYYLAMELVEGLSLGDLVDAPMDVGTAVGLACQILDALAHVHARGILHRDVKPDNVLVQRGADGRLHAKVGDFGIAAALGDAQSTRLTAEGVAIGTPAYMAPEQALADRVDAPTTDLYPVGVVLFRLLSGRLPFEGHLTRVMFAKVTEDPPAAADRDGGALPDALAGAIARLLARRPEARYAVAADALADLRPLATEPRLDEAAWLAAGGGHEPEDGGTVADTLDVAAGPPRARSMPLVGRDAELESLGSIARDVERGAGRVVLLAGEPGMGASRLGEHVAVGLAESGRFSVVRATFYESVGGIESLRAAVERMFGTSGRPLPEVERLVREFLRMHGEEDAREVEELMGFLRPSSDRPDLDSPDARGRRYALLLRLMRRLSRDRPLVVLIDDIHAGGADAAAFLEYLLFEIDFEPAPLLFLATVQRSARSRDFEQGLARSERFEGEARRVLTLGPVGVEPLARGLIEAGMVSPDAAAVVARRSGGNPLYAMHLAKGGDAGVAGTSTGATRGSDPTSGLPDVLRRMLEASLEEQLGQADDPKPLRELLARLAVLGVRARVDELEELVDGEAWADRLDDLLDYLLDAGTLRDDVVGGVEVVAFARVLARDAVLLGMHGRRLRRLHRRAAEVRQRSGDEARAGAIGDHLDGAGDAAAAVDWWLRAMAWSVRSGDLGRAAHWGRKAVGAMEPTDERRPAAQTRLGRLLLDSGDLDGAAAELAAVVEADDVDLALIAGDVLGEVFENKGRGDAWEDLLERMEARRADAGPAGLRALARARALWLNTQVDPDQGKAAAQEALRGAEPGLEIQRGAQRLAFACMLQGDGEGSVAAARLSLEHAGARADLQARALRTLALALLTSGRAAESLAAATEELELVRRTGQAARVPVALSDVGYAQEGLEDRPAARGYYEESRRAARQLGMEGQALYCDFRLIACDLSDGLTEGVGSAIDVYCDKAMDSGLTLIAWARRPLHAWLAANLGRFDDAWRTMEQLDFMRSYPTFHHVGDCLRGMGERFIVAADLAVREQGRLLLREAEAFWLRAGNPAEVARVRGLLDG